MIGTAFAAGALGSPSAIRGLLAAQADELKKRGKSMILLWMDGAPSQFETFNPKDDSANQGPAKSIPTKLPGVRFAEYWTKTAEVADKIALIRSMKSGEADHFRAIKLVKSGYAPNPAIRYPTWGSVVAMQKGDPNFDLPNYVRLGKPRIATRDIDHGVLGTRYAGFKVDEPGKLPEDVVPADSEQIIGRRLALTEALDGEFARQGGKSAVAEKRAIYDRARQFAFSPRLNTFDLSGEPDKLRDAYGRTVFGQGCLLARRLVEAGVPFIEVYSIGSTGDQGWDTHKNGFKENPLLAHETDPGYATLLTDLAERGLLENTLVVWMGEFGRTPKFKADGGRDHYAEGWCVGMSGCGVRGGQVIGATDKDGVKVTDRPLDVPDLYRSICKCLEIDPEHEYVTNDNRPLKLVEKGKIIDELFTG
ncbi:MAG: DUF1501 domain-containing protein [Pirellulales bacterium]